MPKRCWGTLFVFRSVGSLHVLSLARSFGFRVRLEKAGTILQGVSVMPFFRVEFPICLPSAGRFRLEVLLVNSENNESELSRGCSIRIQCRADFSVFRPVERLRGDRPPPALIVHEATHFSEAQSFSREGIQESLIRH